MSGAMSDMLCDKCYFGLLFFCIIDAYRYETVISFADISGSNGLILMKFIQLIQWVVWSLNINFQAILIYS